MRTRSGCRAACATCSRCCGTCHGRSTGGFGCEPQCAGSRSCDRDRARGAGADRGTRSRGRGYDRAGRDRCLRGELRARCAAGALIEPRRDMHLTRRTLLGGAVAAGAASVLAPAESLAAVLEPAPGVFSSWVGPLRATSDVLAAAKRFELVGVQWAGRSHPRIELRTRGGGGRWSRWALASVCGHGPDRASAGDARFGEPIWTGPADALQLRSDGAVDGVRLHFVAAHIPGAASAASSLPLVATGLDAGPGQPPIIARAAWARGGAPPRFPPAYGSVKLAFVHHSEGPNGYRAVDVPAILRSIYQFHRFVRGYNDIGYNFAIDAFGRIWEARAGGVDEPVIGAQAGGYNFA